jgi:RNA polymerase sigma factor (sigma-70 family)
VVKWPNHSKLIGAASCSLHFACSDGTMHGFVVDKKQELAGDIVDKANDEQLMARLQQGHTDALDELYRRYARKLYVFCNNVVRIQGAHDPEDLVQDVFVRVIKAAHTFDPQKASFRTWLFRIARNRCIDVARRAQILTFLSLRKTAAPDEDLALAAEDIIVDRKADVKEAMSRAAVAEAIRDCIQALENRDERQAIVLYYLEGKVYREIAEILGKSTSTAKNRVQAAQAKVKRCLEQKDVNPTA